MPDFRSFARLSNLEAPEIVLSPEESHHLIRVNRARVGDPVVVFNGEGDEWQCECVESDRRAARLKVLSHRQIPPPPARITLAQALPKGKTLDLIIRKATELGAASIVPLTSARTEVRLGEARQEAKGEKWEVTAIEAAKQSGNSYLPAIEPVQSFDEFMAETGRFDLRLIASLEPGAASLRAALDAHIEKTGALPAHPVWLIGPEGDFTSEEYQAAEQAGFSPITLGPLVLRCETAALYALSILRYELHNR